MTNEFNDVLLVYEKNGKVEELFCSPQEADQRFKAASANRSGASIFAFEGCSASMMLPISPQSRDRVNMAKDKLRSQIKLRDAMDNHGIPDDQSLRSSITKVIKDMGFGF